MKNIYHFCKASFRNHKSICNVFKWIDYKSRYHYFDLFKSEQAHHRDYVLVYQIWLEEGTLVSETSLFYPQIKWWIQTFNLYASTNKVLFIDDLHRSCKHSGHSPIVPSSMSRVIPLTIAQSLWFKVHQGHHWVFDDVSLFHNILASFPSKRGVKTIDESLIYNYILICMHLLLHSHFSPIIEIWKPSVLPWT